MGVSIDNNHVPKVILHYIVNIMYTNLFYPRKTLVHVPGGIQNVHVSTVREKKVSPNTH